MNNSWINHICKIMSKCHVLLTRASIFISSAGKIESENQSKVFRVAVSLWVTVTQNFILYF